MLRLRLRLRLSLRPHMCRRVLPRGADREPGDRSARVPRRPPGDTLLPRGRLRVIEVTGNAGDFLSVFFVPIPASSVIVTLNLFIFSDQLPHLVIVTWFLLDFR